MSKTINQRKKLFNQYHPLVDTLVRTQVSPSFKSIFFEDLLQEGSKGLWEATQKYDSSKTNTNPEYFFKWWITARIKRYIYKNASRYKVPGELTRQILRSIKDNRYKITYTKNKKIIRAGFRAFLVDPFRL